MLSNKIIFTNQYIYAMWYLCNMNSVKDIEIRPQAGFQQSYASSNIDVVFGGGIQAAGKSFAIVLALETKRLVVVLWRSSSRYSALTM